MASSPATSGVPASSYMGLTDNRDQSFTWPTTMPAATSTHHSTSLLATTHSDRQGSSHTTVIQDTGMQQAQVQAPSTEESLLQAELSALQREKTLIQEQVKLRELRATIHRERTELEALRASLSSMPDPPHQVNSQEIHIPRPPCTQPQPSATAQQHLIELGLPAPHHQQVAGGCQPPQQPKPQRATNPVPGVPTLAQLRELSALDQQAQDIIFQTSTAAAIARAPPVYTPPTATPATAPAVSGKATSTFVWPNECVHRAGHPDLRFEQLTIQELVIGSVRVALLPNTPAEERQGRLLQLIDVMILSQQYRWDRVRSLLQEALSQISRGRRQWSEGLTDLQPEMLKAWDILPRPQSHGSTTLATPHKQICFQWNTGKDGCPRGSQCPYLHICKDCWAHTDR